MANPDTRPDGVVEAEGFLGGPVEVLGILTGGEDAQVLKVRSAGRDWALRVSYERRADRDLEWVSRWVEHAAVTVPETVIRERRGGHSFFRTARGGVATVLPFVEGSRPRRGDPAVLPQAATLLARIHRAGLHWHGRPGGSAPSGPRTVPTPPAFRDPDLDEAWARALERGLRTGPVHGDFYAGNLLALDASVVAVLDWDDAGVRPLLLEIAGAAFEFSRDREHRLDPDRARGFVMAYRAAGGPLDDEELASLGLAMRVWVRRDARVSLAYDPTGSAYVELQARAFRELPDDQAWVRA